MINSLDNINAQSILIFIFLSSHDFSKTSILQFFVAYFHFYIHTNILNFSLKNI